MKKPSLRPKMAHVRLLPEAAVPEQLRGYYRGALRELAANGIYGVDQGALQNARETGDLFLGLSFHDFRLFEVL